MVPVRSQLEVGSAEQSPQRMAVIDSTRSLDEVKAQIRAAIVARPQLQLTIE